MDNKYNCLKLIVEEQGDEIEMCQSLDMFAQKNRLQGKEEGKREGMLEGKREGILEGKREGILEGRRQGKALLLIQVLKRMFSLLPKEVIVAVKNSNEKQLDQIIECIFDIKDPSDIFEILQ